MKKKLLSIISLLILNFINTNAQTSFSPHLVFTTEVNAPWDVKSEDIDNDGDEDIVFASSSGDKVGWMENFGSGVFSAPVTISVNVEYAVSVEIKDIDGDGDFDVISGSISDNKIAWYENTDGLGAFSPEIIVTTSAGGTEDIHCSDLDGDGDFDIITANTYSFAWYENDGTGNFGSANTISSGIYAGSSVFSADLDNDGDLDIVTAEDFNNKISWHENTDGNGTFSGASTISSTASYAKSVFCVDIDGDGDIDVLSASESDDKVAWYENTNGQGNFSTEIIVSDSANGTNSVHAADIDGDIDVIASAENANEISWFENINGNGQFTEHLLINTAFGAKSVFASDLDGDNDLDILASSLDDDAIMWFENMDGNGTFGERILLTEQTSGAFSVFAADMDGDSDIDIISGCDAGNQVAWHENLDGNGTFGNIHIISDSSKGVRSVFVSDIDGDGDSDVVSAAYTDHDVLWHRNADGMGNFDSAFVVKHHATTAYTSVYSGDFDGDLDNDIVTVGHTGGISWFANTNGNGVFDNGNGATSVGAFPSKVIATDIDGDNDLDFLSASSSDDLVAWSENTDGNGNYGTKQTISTLYKATSVEAIDIDGDGDLDVVANSWLSNGKTVWYENTDGLGTFGPENIIGYAGSGCEYLTSGDLDNDGDADIIAAGNPGVVWFENTDGAGTFSSSIVISSTVSGVRSIFIVDLDTDGDNDIVTASESDDKIMWFENSLITALEIDSIYTLNEIQCNNGNDGSIDVWAMGGTTPYSYLWSDGQSTSISTGLSAGIHHVTVFDNNNNTIVSSQMLYNPDLITATDVQNACTEYTWIDGNTYSSDNNSATYILSNTEGCDSLITLNLTVFNSTSSTITESTCGSYFVPSGDETYTTSGTYLDTIPNSYGCDSVLTINLTISDNDTDTHVITACDSYTWIDGITYNSSNTSATHIISGATTNGCDSIISLNLTISNSSVSTETLSSCDSYTWLADNNTYNTSGTYTALLTNVAGCDSTATLNLTINSVDTSITQSGNMLTSNASNATYQWVDCDNGNTAISSETSSSFTSTNNGNFAVEITQNGCVDTSNCYSITGTGILENSFENLVVYPNPTNGLLTIEIDNTYGNVTIIQSTLTGQVVKNQTFFTTNKLDFEIIGETGIYIVDLKTDDGKTAKIKVIKQ